jgi:hypothetical protein
MRRRHGSHPLRITYRLKLRILMKAENAIPDH